MERLYEGGDGEAGGLGLSSGETDMGDLGTVYVHQGMVKAEAF